MSSSFSVVKPSYLENTSNIVVNGNLTVNGTVSKYFDTSLKSFPENTYYTFGNLNENNVNDYVMRVMNLVKMDNKLLSSIVKKIVVIEVINKLLDELTPESKASLQLNINKILSGKNNFFV